MDGLLRLAGAFTASATWWVFLLASAVGCVVLVLRLASFVRRLATGDADARRRAFVSCALFAIAFAVRWLLPERTHYTFNDEYEYVAYARTLLATHVYGLPSGPPAGVFLWALAFVPLGVSTHAVFTTTIVLGSLTPPALAWMLRVLRVERAVALTAAVLLALAPLHVKHSASASLEVLSLLCVVLAVGTFVELLRTPGLLRSVCFAVSLFFALTMRVENWALLALLPLVWWLWRDEARLRSPVSALFVPPALAVAVAAVYVPGILAAPIRWEPAWKSRLPAAKLLLTNLAFFVGGDPWTGKVPLVLGAVGLVAGLRTRARAVALWLAFLLLYSVIYVFYGLNVGWLEEPHQPPPWGARGAGHDMFRFNVVLLAPVVLLLAYGLVALARGAWAALRVDVDGRRRPLRVAALAGGVVLVAVLLAWRGEYATYRPLELIASRYNRGYEIAELRFLLDATASVAAGARLYLPPPAQGIVLGEIETRPLAALHVDLARGNTGGEALLYVSGRHLGVSGVRTRIATLQRRFELHEIARRREGPDTFQLFALRPRKRAAAAQ
ncbi:MAG TPA: hypothetical protein VIS07_03810 [Candidatus Binatia bacterium]